MYCDNCFCVYWLNNCCFFDEISLDALGRCQDCICVNISEEVLQKERKKVLDYFEDTYKRWNQE